MNKANKNINVGKVVLCKSGLQVQLKEETVWLSQAQMCELFDKNNI